MKLYISLLIFILVMGFASALINELEPTRLGNCKQIVQIDTQTDEETLTFILRPDGTIEKLQAQMQNFGNNSFNYTYCNTNLTGFYTANGVGNYSGSEWSYKFYINLQGKKYGSAEGTLYVAVLIVLIFIGIFLIYIFMQLSFKDVISNEGHMIAVNWKKYLKMFLFGIIYLWFLALVYFMWNISLGILEFNEMGNFFFVLYNLTIILMYPFLLILLVFGLIKFFTDLNFKKILDSGGTIR